MTTKRIAVLGLLAASVGACSRDGTGIASQANEVVLDVRCTADADCPGGFTCEAETEHGAQTSVCVSDAAQGTATGKCPPGYELEEEHTQTLCKPHGGGDDDRDAGEVHGDGDAGEVHQDDGDAGEDHGDAGAQTTCTTDADCAAGLECEIQVENGVMTGVCKAHGGKP